MAANDLGQLAHLPAGNLDAGILGPGAQPLGQLGEQGRVG